MNLLVRIVASVVVASAFCLAANRFLAANPHFAKLNLIVGGGIAGLGLVTWMAARARRDADEREQASYNNPGTPEGQPPVKLGSLQFWGPVVALCGLTLAGLHQINAVVAQFSAKTRVNAHARSGGPPDRAHAPAETRPARDEPPRGFFRPRPARPSERPELRVQAIFFRPARSSAIVDGRTLFVGDRLGPFTVLSIERHAVTLENEGNRRVLKMGQSPPPPPRRGWLF